MIACVLRLEGKISCSHSVTNEIYHVLVLELQRLEQTLQAGRIVVRMHSERQQLANRTGKPFLK